MEVLIVREAHGMNTHVTIGKLKLKNPVLVASGTFGYAQEFERFIPVKQLGAIVTKTITKKPREGNPPPRIVETASGMLNAIGIQNEGIENFVHEKLPFLRKLGVPIVVSIGGQTTQEYIALAKILHTVKGVDALELNISCPNVERSRRLVSHDPNATALLVRAVRKVTKKTIITKLSPNVGDIVSIACAAQDAGSDALCLVNTLLGMSVDITTKAPKLGNVTGGLSGPAIKPIALRMVWEVARAVHIPVIGVGGIMNASDAIEFLMCGAHAVCLGTANFVDPSASIKTIKGIRDYLKKNKINNINRLIGSLKTV